MIMCFPTFEFPLCEYLKISRTSLTILSEYVWDEIQQICHALSICHYCMQIYNTHGF